MTPFFKTHTMYKCTSEFIFARIINYYRLSSHLTQIEFGERIGLSQETIQRIETCKITYEALISSDKVSRIEKALSLSSGTISRYHKHVMNNVPFPAESNTADMYSILKNYKYFMNLSTLVKIQKRNEFIDGCIDVLNQCDLVPVFYTELTRWFKKVQSLSKNYKMYNKSRIDYYQHRSRIFIDFRSNQYVLETFAHSQLMIKITKCLLTDKVCLCHFHRLH